MENQFTERDVITGLKEIYNFGEPGWHVNLLLNINRALINSIEIQCLSEKEADDAAFFLQRVHKLLFKAFQENDL